MSYEENLIKTGAQSGLAEVMRYVSADTNEIFGSKPLLERTKYLLLAMQKQFNILVNDKVNEIEGRLREE